MDLYIENRTKYYPNISKPEIEIKFEGQYGKLIINEPKYAKFKPLLSGSQQDNLRGGTYNSYAYQNIPQLKLVV